eukprot:TRINITY_DN90_c0_g1_i12.p1 TRINITY_DN90_c0_g1~~TRINITY_DN90_c0_g1_i12.p1  ORF type:complete len:136 (-),score=12.92 TRINITY_DN90_c0_g1_i12:28-435(-)
MKSFQDAPEGRNNEAKPPRGGGREVMDEAPSFYSFRRDSSWWAWHRREGDQEDFFIFVSVFFPPSGEPGRMSNSFYQKQTSQGRLAFDLFALPIQQPSIIKLNLQNNRIAITFSWKKLFILILIFQKQIFQIYQQ